MVLLRVLTVRQVVERFSSSRKQLSHLNCKAALQQLSTATTPYPPLLSSLSSTPVCEEQGLINLQSPCCCSFVALFPASSPLVFWQRDLVLFPFGRSTPPRLSPLPPFSLRLLLLHLPPRRWVEREQPVLSKHKDRSCQQVAMATASLSPATSPLGKRECGELQGPSFVSTLSHSPN